MAQATCAYCGRPLCASEIRRVPGSVAAAVEIAFAFFHGGLWAWETMARPFCARCVRRITAASILISAVILTAASFSLAIWLRGPSR